MRTPTVLRQPSELAGSSALRRISHSPNDKDVETVSRRFLKCVDWHVVRLRLRAVEVECKIRRSSRRVKLGRTTCARGVPGVTSVSSNSPPEK